MGVCGPVVMAADCWMRRRVGRGYVYVYVAHDLFGFGGMRAFFHRYGRNFTVQCDGGGDGKL
jgi:hypothetical protein